MSLNSPSIQTINGSDLRVAIISARYNEELVNSLLENTIAALRTADTPEPAIERVPGSAELPYAADKLARHGLFDVVIVLGVVIAGDTNHHAIIGESTAFALQEISIRREVPVINGILVVNTLAQAEARVDKPINRGEEVALAALEMAQFNKRWKTTNR